MDFEMKEVTSYKNGSVLISNNEKIVKLNDGSVHKIPVVNLLALKHLNNKGIELQEATTTVCKTEDANDELEAEINEEMREPISSLKHLMEVTGNKATLISFLKSCKLMCTKLDCEHCGIEMLVRKYSKVSDGYAYYCSKCKKTSNIRIKSFFAGSRIDLGDIVMIMYLWSNGVQAFICRRLLPNLNERTIHDWYSFCRDICIKHFDDNPTQFNKGNLQTELQIDESIFGKKRKYNRGKNFQRFWIFGISDAENHKVHIEIVETRDRETLQNIILKHVIPSKETRIVSDGWAAYNQLQDIGFQHEVVIHEQEFVNQDGFHTNSIESVWSQFKNWINSMHGVSHKCYRSYIAEFMFRYNYAGSYRGNCFKKLIEEIAKQYHCS